MNTFFNKLIVLELIFEWSRRFANDTFSIRDGFNIHFSVQNKFYAIHTNFLPAVLNSTSVRLRYSNLTRRNPVIIGESPGKTTCAFKI